MFDDFVRNNVVPLLCAANEESKEDIQLALHRKFKRIQVVKLYHIKCEEKSEEICIAYLVILHEKQTIAVVFRGYKNVEVFLNKMTNPLELREWIDFNVTGSKVIGYSQGGAIASIASTIFVRNGYVDSHDLKQFTLGQPRVGDLAFAQGHDQFVPFSFRIVNKHDPIPTLPRRDFILDSKLGPHHHRYEVWYKNSMSQASNHMVSHMAEDPLGRASEELVTDPHDHLNYFDVDISSCQV
uniref:Fungal lipase-like domain-containing protein n=1 Tax=Acrobeloides nanus TaxID=290746 RepID=A0A914EM76_9BILA